MPASQPVQYSPPDQTSFFADMLAQATDGVIIIDDMNNVVFFNTAAERLWGCTAGEVLGRNVKHLVPMEHRGRHDGYVNRNRETGQRRIVGTLREVTFVRSNGDYVAAEMSISSALVGVEQRRYYMAVLKGVTEESHRRKLLDLQGQVFTVLAADSTAQDVADMLCAEAERLVPNSIAALLQVTPERWLEVLSGEGLPRRWMTMLAHVSLSDDDVQTLCEQPKLARSIVWRDMPGADGQEAELFDCWASAVRNGAGELIGIFVLYSRNREKMTDWPQKIVTGCVPSCAAIIEQGKTRQRLNHLDRYDALTGLLNRSSIATVLREMTGVASPLPFALLMLDLDLFQDVNNVLGYDQGDVLLQTVARRLAAHCRSNFVIGRLGGDDFVVVIPGGDREGAGAFADSLADVMRAPVEVGSRELVLSFSIGISLYPDDGTDVEHMLGRAETAMRDAKTAARGSYRFFGGFEHKGVEQRLIIGTALRDAARQGQMRLFYQPQINAAQRTLYGVEALARWTHPVLGSVPPSRFIPIAEETGQIEELGRWSLTEVCRQLVEWDAMGLHVPVVAVNISATHFCSAALPRQIVSLLDEYGLAPQRLTIEITEGVMMRQNAETMATIAAIRAIGVGLSLDDFGTGFSSLSRLADLPLTEIKIDRSFVANFEEDVGAFVVTEAAINIGKRLGITVVTEGVETEIQNEKLLDMGCDVVQGYLFGRPVPPAEFQNWHGMFFG